MNETQTVFSTDYRPPILAVDDDELNLMMIEQILGDRVAFNAVTDGHAALDFLTHHSVDLVLLDYNMPDIDGLTTLKIMKEREEIRNVPVIIMTADSDVNIETAVFRAGASDFIRKPFVPPALNERCMRVLESEYLKKNLRRDVSRQTQIAEQRLRLAQKLFDETVLALAQTIDAKDAYTQGHSQRVADYSVKIAAMNGASVEEQRDIFCMGLLHDIGKIGIPDAIINKPSRLTDEEYAVIKSHTVIGSTILANIEQFPKLAIGARHHHERYDGRGYPDGLRGEKIPVEARIIAVADAYDAMTSKRSYRNTLPQEKVRSEIEKGRDLQFDARFADIMLQMIDEDVNFTMQGDHSHEEKPLEHDG